MRLKKKTIENLKSAVIRLNSAASYRKKLIRWKAAMDSPLAYLLTDWEQPQHQSGIFL